MIPDPLFTAAKARHPGMVLLWYIDGTYRTFHEDAVTVRGIWGADSFPSAELESVLRTLLKRKLRVAICDGAR